MENERDMAIRFLIRAVSEAGDFRHPGDMPSQLIHTRAGSLALVALGVDHSEILRNLDGAFPETVTEESRD